MQILKYSVDVFLHFNERDIENFLEICENIIDKMSINTSTIFKLKSAAQELIVNAIEHGYEKTQGNINFSILKSDNKITIEISDEGKGISKPSVGDIPENMSLESMRARGWGLIILKGLSQTFNIKCNRHNGTIVTVVFIDN